MTRMHLLSAASAAALVCISAAAIAKTKTPGTILGGGSTLAGFDYPAEFAVFNATKTVKATWSTYWLSGSGTGQQAFIQDDLSCDISKAQTGTASCNGNGGAAGNTVDYGASDATLSSAQIATWSTSTFGQSAAGDLIQLPSMGTGVAIPLNETVHGTPVTNGQATFSDNDLCGIFSGLITNFSQITDTGAALDGGNFTVAYRSDSSGTTFLLTQHLAAVCKTGNGGNSAITFTATTSFASLFANKTPPAQFVGESGSGGVANYLEGANCPGGTALPQALGYISPDYTTLFQNSYATVCSDDIKSTLNVAAVYTGSASLLPTLTNVTKGLANPGAGSTNATPPANATDAADPTKWVPGIPVVKAGYGIVGYTTFDFAQCYAEVTVADAIKKFLMLHYHGSAYKTIQADNGFVTIVNSGAAKYYDAILGNIIKNKRDYNTNIQNPIACKGLVGR